MLHPSVVGATEQPKGPHMAYRSSVRTITVKFAGNCACCGATIKAGELADYHPRMRKIAHMGGLDGNSSRCTFEIRQQCDVGFIDIDRAYEDQCADICGR
jgi:hypothetical protein